METIIVTGSGGLIGSEAAKFFHEKGFHIVGIDNDMRSYFFGEEASTNWNVRDLQNTLKNYTHYNIDIRNEEDVNNIFKEHAGEISGIIHTAAQPSHDWAAKEPMTDFSINATGTLILLEATRKFCKDAIFIFTSTNKVYGDTPNFLPLKELDKRWEIDESHPFHKNGIDETMSIDQTKHSIFGASKVAADVLCQEYGRYFNMNTVVFRGGCLTGPAHSGAELHGFLAYLVKCAITGKPYTIFGYKGKQVRDNIHSYDLINAFWHYYQNPKQAAVYNIGGGRFSNTSMLEAIESIKDISGHNLNYTLSEENRIGDHIWYISDLTAFETDYPNWKLTYDIPTILTEMIANVEEKQSSSKSN